MNESLLLIPKEIAAKMQELAEKGLPFEICGLLSGKSLVVESLWELETKYKHRSQFFVEEHKVEEILKKIENQGEEVLAIYHSHPTAAAIPSTLDILHHPDSTVFMIIISLKDEKRQINCFEINEGISKQFPYSII